MLNVRLMDLHQKSMGELILASMDGDCWRLRYKINFFFNEINFCFNKKNFHIYSH